MILRICLIQINNLYKQPEIGPHCVCNVLALDRLVTTQSIWFLHYPLGYLWIVQLFPPPPPPPNDIIWNGWIKLQNIMALKVFTLWCWGWYIPGKLGQYSGCWCHGFLHWEGSNSLSVYHLWSTGLCFPWSRALTLYAIPVFWNAMKCK